MRQILLLGSGIIGLVQQSAAGQPITVGAATDGTVVNFTGTAGARTLTGLAAGTLSAASTDAVNGSQLFATNQNVTANTTAIASLSTSTSANMSNVAAALGGGASVDESSSRLPAVTVSISFP